MPRHVLVTGVSTGIGRAAALSLVAAGYHVFGSVRRPEDATAFAAEAGGGATALTFDVTDSAAVAAAAAQVADAVGKDGLAGLVNNAGTAVAGPLEHLPLDAFREQLEINVTSVLAVTQVFLPLLKASRPRGRIVNISSVSGRTVMPFTGPYGASKFALEGLSDALRRELAVYGIDVVVIQPSSIATPIWDKAAASDRAPYAGTAYEKPLAEIARVAEETGKAGLPAERVGALVARIFSDRRPKARYLVARRPMQQKIMRLLPTRLLDRLIARTLKIRREEPREG